jgi:cation:H+ antiporter
VALQILAMAGGALALALAADAFVLGAARLAMALRVSAVVVGAVVIGCGTSLPELVTGALAAGQGALGIAVGSLVGSNVANLTLVAGAAAVVAPIAIASATLRREAPLALLATVGLALLVPGGMGRVEGAILLAAFAGALALMLAGARRPDEPLREEVDRYAGPAPAVRREALRVGAALVGVAAGAQALVWGATGLAADLGVADGVIGLTAVAVGTSLPELVTAVQAARRGEPDLIVGNLLGSTVFNSLGIAGVAVLIGPGTVDGVGAGPLIAMVAVAALAAGSMATGRRLSRLEGAALVACYAALLPLVLTG